MAEKTEDEILPAGKAVDRIGEKLIEAMRTLTTMRGLLLDVYAALADLRRERKEEKP